MGGDVPAGLRLHLQGLRAGTTGRFAFRFACRDEGVTILLDRLGANPAIGKALKLSPAGLVPLRIHQDVVDLAYSLAARDADKLKASAAQLFMPANDCWFEWPAGQGDMGVMFLSRESVRTGHGAFYAWKHKGEEEGPTMIPLKFNLPAGRVEVETTFLGSPGVDADVILLGQQLEVLKPVILAFLALINSPKIVRRDPARLDPLNRKRQAVGRYTFHPHHVVRLNVDKKAVRVGSSAGGDGATRALHFVRAHLRLWNGQYILVQPHWRGDPQVGIIKPGYEIDRQGSTWSS